MSTIQIHMFGRFTMLVDNQLVGNFLSQKALELFCFLLLNYDQPHHREQLAELFWSNRPTNQSRKCFRKTIWQLQSTLDNIPIEKQSRFILVEPDWLQFNQHMDIWVDVLEFSKIYSSINDTRGGDMDGKILNDAEYAESIYKGDLLQGWYQDWCVLERERLRDMYFLTVEKIMGYCEINQEYEMGVSYGRKLLAWDPARESTHFRLMKLYQAMGQRTSALRQFEFCKNVMKEEFNLEPDERTIKLYHQIAKNDSDQTTQTISKFKQDQNHLNNRLKSLNRIKELATIQADVSNQVMAEIKKLEDTLVS